MRSKRSESGGALIRPRPEQIAGWAKEAGLLAAEAPVIDLPPWHCGLRLSRGGNHLSRLPHQSRAVKGEGAETRMNTTTPTTVQPIRDHASEQSWGVRVGLAFKCSTGDGVSPRAAAPLVES
jgi:hypothetical protein